MDHVTLTLKPDPGTPEDLPFRTTSVDVPLRPGARPVNIDPIGAIGFPVVVHRSRTEPLSFAISSEMADAFAWFDDLFSRQGYSKQMSKGRTGNTRTGEFADWMVLTVSPPENPDLFIQLTFRRHGRDETLLTYCAEEHPAPRRNPASHLSASAERVEVEYTFLNGPQRTIHRIVTDPAAIRALADAINAFPRVKWAASGGTKWPGGWADLRFIYPGEPERKVHVDASHGVVIVDDFPALQGNLWFLLVKVAPPPKGASGIPGIDWERTL